MIGFVMKNVANDNDAWDDASDNWFGDEKIVFDAFIFGTRRNDHLLGTSGNDLIRGFAGNDVIGEFSANPEALPNGRDYLDGGDGNDTIYGYSADHDADTLVGGLGDDVLSVVVGERSYLYGGDGNDTLSGTEFSAFLRHSGGNGNDVIYLSQHGDTAYGGNGNDVLEVQFFHHYGNAGLEAYAYGEAGDDQINLAGTNYGFADGGTGNDRILGAEFGNTLSGGDGNDTIEGNGDSNDIIAGGNGDDYLDGQGGYDAIYGGAGNDLIYGGEQASILYGDDGNDIIIGRAGSDRIFGGAGNDRITPGSGNNTVDAGSGNDSIMSLRGNDTMTGGKGADTFEFVYAWNAQRQSEITDFTMYADHIIMRNWGMQGTTLDVFKSFLSDNGAGGTLLTLDNGNTYLNLVGVPLASINDRTFNYIFSFES
jgi:Ca2+-binding RTX toxin-like protein